MKDTNYAYSVALVRTLENKMLTKSDIDMLLNAKSAQDAVRLLADKGYGGGEMNISNWEQALARELENAWREVQAACPEGTPIDVLLYKNDFHNLKTILKANYSAQPWENLMLKPCTTAPQTIADCIKRAKPEDLPPLMREAAIEAYDVLTKTGDGQLLEVILDKAVFSAMAQSTKIYKNEFFTGYISLSCDIVNMKTAVRGARAGIDRRLCEYALVPHGKFDLQALTDAVEDGMDAVYEIMAQTGYESVVKAAQISVGELEKQCDNMLTDYIKSYKSKAFGFEPILGYLKGKETEIQAVRIIMSGHINNIGREAVAERLRELYV